MSMIRAMYCIRPDERGYDTRKVEKFAPFRSGFECKRQAASDFFAGEKDWHGICFTTKRTPFHGGEAKKKEK